MWQHGWYRLRIFMDHELISGGGRYDSFVDFDLQLGDEWVLKLTINQSVFHLSPKRRCHWLAWCHCWHLLCQLCPFFFLEIDYHHWFRLSCCDLRLSFIAGGGTLPLVLTVLGCNDTFEIVPVFILFLLRLCSLLEHISCAEWNSTSVESCTSWNLVMTSC